MDMSVENVFLIPTGDAFQKAYLEEWQRIDDEQGRDPGRTIYRRVPVLQNLRSLRNPGARITISSKSNLGTPRPQNLRRKQLENLTRQPGSFRELRVPWPFGKYRRHHCLPKKCVQLRSPKSSIVPFPIV